MARNMNPSSFISDYNLGSIPTPPWKTNLSSNLSSNTNTFPIPPRNNDLGISPKSTNYEWKKAGGTAPNISQSGASFTGQGGGGFVGSDYSRLGNQGFQSQANSNIGIGSGNTGGNLFGVASTDYRSSSGIGGIGGKSDSTFDGNFRSGFGSNAGGFKDNIVYHNQSGGRLGDKPQGGVQDRNIGSSNNNLDSNRDNNNRDGGNFDGRSRQDNFPRGNNAGNFERGSNFNNTSNNDRPGNFNQSADRGNNPKGLLDSPSTASFNDNRNNSSNDFRNNQNRRQSSPRRTTNNTNNTTNEQDSFRRRSVRNQATLNPAKPIVTPPKYPLKNPVKAEDLELEKKAFATDVSQDFFAKIKPLSLMQVAADVALRYARQEYYLTVLNRKTCPEKPSGSGQYTCKTCYMNFLTKEKLNTHNNGPQHKELEDLFRIKKEQARLIMEKKIFGPTPPKLEMKPITEAEAENNLKPTELELDVYILGIYESVMKPYWPVPQSKYYCRMCNYLEFNSEAELRRHNTTNEHKKREMTYEEAFCLYCQRHYNDRAQLDTHITTAKHIQIKDLMERTKEAAVEQWHKANDVPRVIEKSDTPKVSDLNEISKDNKDALKIGSKRVASDDGNKSPMKKASTGKPDASAKSLRTDSASKSESRVEAARRSDRERSDSKSSDKKSSSKSDSKSTPKSDGKPAAKSDAKPYSKSDSRPPAKSDAKDTKDGSKSDPKPDPKSDSKGGSKSDLKSDSKSDSKSESKSDSKSDPKSVSKSDGKAEVKTTKDSPDKEKIWFAPVIGSVCIVCHDFIKDDAEQKIHASLSKHIENVKKFKSVTLD